MIRVMLLIILPLLLSACAAPPATDPLATLRQADGSLVWEQEYTFTSPGDNWTLIRLDEDDFSFAFALKCSEQFPCLSTIAYSEEPFGYSKDLEKRQEEFFKRYLWASRVVFAKPILTKKVLHGQEVLVAIIEGKEPVKRQKVRSKVVFMHRGERVVAFYLSQWRCTDDSYDKAEEADFDHFVDSFGYLKPSFFETL